MKRFFATYWLPITVFLAYGTLIYIGNKNISQTTDIIDYTLRHGKTATYEYRIEKYGEKSLSKEEWHDYLSREIIIAGNKYMTMSKIYDETQNQKDYNDMKNYETEFISLTLKLSEKVNN